MKGLFDRFRLIMIDYIDYVEQERSLKYRKTYETCFSIAQSVRHNVYSL